MVPALRPLDRILTVSTSWEMTPAARPYSVSFALSSTCIITTLRVRFSFHSFKKNTSAGSDDDNDDVVDDANDL